MNEALKILLDELDEISEEFDEVSDTEVRDRMHDAVENGVLSPVAGYALPNSFGMYEPEGDAKVKAALDQFIPAAVREADAAGVKAPDERLRAFQDNDVMSKAGNYCDQYFGYDDRLEREANAAA